MEKQTESTEAAESSGHRITGAGKGAALGPRGKQQRGARPLGQREGGQRGPASGRGGGLFKPQPGPRRPSQAAAAAGQERRLPADARGSSPFGRAGSRLEPRARCVLERGPRRRRKPASPLPWLHPRDANGAAFPPSAV